MCKELLDHIFFSLLFLDSRLYNLQANLWSLVHLTLSLVLIMILLVTLAISQGLAANSDLESFVTLLTGLDVSLITTSTIVELCGLMVTIVGHVSSFAYQNKL